MRRRGRGCWRGWRPPRRSARSPDRPTDGPCSRRTGGSSTCDRGGPRCRPSRSPGPWPPCGRCGRPRRRPLRRLGRRRGPRARAGRGQRGGAGEGTTGRAQPGPRGRHGPRRRRGPHGQPGRPSRTVACPTLAYGSSRTSAFRTSPGQGAGGLVQGHEQLADRRTELGDVSWVATALSRDGGGVEYPGPALHARPVSVATTLVLALSNKRRGRSERPQPVALTDQRGSGGRPRSGVHPTSRLPAKVEALTGRWPRRRSNPSKAWSTMTLAITRAGMVGRPFFELVYQIGEVVVGQHDLTVIGQRGGRASLPSVDHRESPSGSRTAAGPVDRPSAMGKFPSPRRRSRIERATTSGAS